MTLERRLSSDFLGWSARSRATMAWSGKRRLGGQGDEPGTRPPPRSLRAARGLMRMKTTIWAAGGVVYRHAPNGLREVLVVHRAHREDWTFPKGKLLHGEDDETCARREVQEETGLRCVLGIELPTTTYITRSGRRKRVRYWAMRPVAGAVGAHNEVDEVRWVGFDAAAALLTYPRDRTLLLAFVHLELDRPRAAQIGRRRGRSPLPLPSSRGLAGALASRARGGGTA